MKGSTEFIVFQGCNQYYLIHLSEKSLIQNVQGNKIRIYIKNITIRDPISEIY